MQKYVFVYIADYEKAFDKVRHVDLFKMLEEAGLDERDLRLMRDLYWMQKASNIVGVVTSMSKEKKEVCDKVVFFRQFFF